MRPNIFEEVKLGIKPKFEAKPKFGSRPILRPGQVNRTRAGQARPGFTVCSSGQQNKKIHIKKRRTYTKLALN